MSNNTKLASSLSGSLLTLTWSDDTGKWEHSIDLLKDLSKKSQIQALAQGVKTKARNAYATPLERDADDNPVAQTAEQQHDRAKAQMESLITDGWMATTTRSSDPKNWCSTHNQAAWCIYMGVKPAEDGVRQRVTAATVTQQPNAWAWADLAISKAKGKEGKLAVKDINDLVLKRTEVDAMVGGPEKDKLVVSTDTSIMRHFLYHVLKSEGKIDETISYADTCSTFLTKYGKAPQVKKTEVELPSVAKMEV